MDKNVIEIEEYIRYLDWKIRRKGRGILENEDLTDLQFYALQMIKFQDGKAMPSYIANLLKLAPSTVSDMIKKMEKSGYIEKTVTEFDKRSFYIDITEKGRKVIDDVIYERHKYISSSLEAEDAKTIETIRDGLKHLFEILRKN